MKIRFSGFIFQLQKKAKINQKVLTNVLKEWLASKHYSILILLALLIEYNVDFSRKIRMVLVHSFFVCNET